MRLQVLAEACLGGDPAACDDLWHRAPLNSEFKRIGGSCGSVISPPAENSFGNCVARFEANMPSTIPSATTTPALDLVVDPTFGSWVVIMRSVASRFPIGEAVAYAQELQQQGIDTDSVASPRSFGTSDDTQHVCVDS